MAFFNIFLPLLLAAAVLSAKFPSDWDKCPKTNNQECLLKSLSKVLKDLKNGRKEVGIVPIDPLRFSQVEMNQGSNSPVNINLTLTNLDVVGISKFRFLDIRIDWDNYDIYFKGDFPESPVSMIGDYTIGGKVLVLPIKGKGKCNITMENPALELLFKGKEMLKNGKKYFDIVQGGFIIQPRKTYFNLTNLFDGIPNLGDNMNKFLNENWLVIINELNGTLSETFGEGVKQVANSFFHRFPVNELYT